MTDTKRLTTLMTGKQHVLFENTARSVGDAPKAIQVRHIANCMRADLAYGRDVAKALGTPDAETPK